MSLEKAAEVARRALLILRGRNDHEVLDPNPIAVPQNAYTPSLREQVQQAVAQEMSRQAELDGKGTFDDEDDFELEEDTLLPFSEHEINYIMANEPIAAPESLDGEDIPAEPNTGEIVANGDAEPNTSSADEAPTA